MKIYVAGSQVPTTGSFKIEASIEDADNRKTADCGCFAAAGYMTVATRDDTVTLPISGPARLLPPDRHTGTSAPFQIAAQTTVSAGTGDFRDSHGHGTVAAVFDGPKVNIVLDWGS